MPHTLTEKHRMIDGALDTLPLILAATPFGILYGALAFSSGLSLWTAMAMSMFVFAGAAQFVAVNLLLAAAPLTVIVLATLIVNMRHLMYSANLIPHVKHLPPAVRAILAFWLTDETFAVVARKTGSAYDRASIHRYYLGSALFMYSGWQLSSLIGYQIGAHLPDLQSWGLEIAMVVAFIGVLVPLLNSPKIWVCAATAFIGSIFMRDLPFQLGLVFSMLLAISIAMFFARLGTQTNE